MDMKHRREAASFCMMERESDRTKSNCKEVAINNLAEDVGDAKEDRVVSSLCRGDPEVENDFLMQEELNDTLPHLVRGEEERRRGGEEERRRLMIMMMMKGR